MISILANNWVAIVALLMCIGGALFATSKRW